MLSRLAYGAAAFMAAAPVGTQDTATLRVPGHAVLDSTVDQTLLPDTITPIVQWIFQKPPWVMWTGAIVAAVLGLAALWWLRGHIKAVINWIRSRSGPIKAALVAAVLLLVLGISAAGMKSYDFMMNDKRMCNGCHVFVASGQVVERPDTGDYTLVNKLEGKHDTLNCHTCHAFDARKEAVKMVLWMSGVRDSSIPEHGKVPRDVCEKCHEQGAAKDTWQAIAKTAGHRTHLESDSSALKDKVECLTCHARSAHRFVPADTTCSQNGCHLTDNVRIRLGRMAGQTGLHCMVCHRFTRVVPALATFDSAKGALTPGSKQCFSCHAMRERLADFNPERDPHGGTCGMCHNPHENVKPKDALKSCADAGCHADWRTVAFHDGKAHRKVATKCEACHTPHAARVDASDCVGCHQSAKARAAERQHPPVPFDTLKALQRTSGPVDLMPPSPHGKGDAPIDDPPPPDSVRTHAPPRPFSHSNHKKLHCITCHDVKSKASTVTFKAPRGCLICHHQAPSKANCATCHSSEQLQGLQVSETIHVQTSAPRAPARSREVSFSHEGHGEVACVTCHTTPVTMAPSPEAVKCQGCHEQHHTEDRNCAACHRAETSWDAHTRASHVDCTACHQATTVSRLTPDRAFCLGCHAPAVDHQQGTACTVCHLFATPPAFRPQLMGLQ